MKKMPLLFAAVLLLFAAACLPAPTLRDETLLKDTSLITGEPCEAPCFYGITPGETNWSEALSILEDQPEFINLQTQTAEDGSARIQVAWQHGEGGGACCQMLTENGQTVRLLFLRTAPVMTLGQVIEAHGEPVYMNGEEFAQDQAIASLVYPDTPMVVYAFVPGLETGTVSETSEIIGVLYFISEDMELLLDTSELHTWEGYQPLQAYLDSELEVTPRVTLTPTPNQ